MPLTFFTRTDGHYVATDMSVSPWSPGQLSGTSVGALLARELEPHCPDSGFVPARFTVDLFRPVLNEPITVKSHIVRDGNRIRVADAAIVQHDQIRARASVMYLTTGEQPPGRVWQTADDLPVPSPDQVGPIGAPPLFKSGDRDWSQDFASGQNSERKCVWHNLEFLVDDEPMSPFERAAFLGDATSMVCNWGTAGVGYINCDVTVTLSRLPEGSEVGLRALDQVAAQGISVATATMYDRTGPLGTSVVNSLSNARRQVDLAGYGAAKAALVHGSR
jgi:Thioesterase-like superfamily